MEEVERRRLQLLQERREQIAASNFFLTAADKVDEENGQVSNRDINALDSPYKKDQFDNQSS